MLTLQIPMLLALLATALMAVVIFAPSRTAAPVAMSFAPPPAPPAMERWEPPPWEPTSADAAIRQTPSWPALVDPRAADCDATARLAIVEALGTIRTRWAQTILSRAAQDDPDEPVRDAASAALHACSASSQPTAGDAG